MSNTASITLPRSSARTGRTDQGGFTRLVSAAVAFLNDTSTGRTSGQGVVSHAFPVAVSSGIGGRTAGHASMRPAATSSFVVAQGLAGHANAVREFPAQGGSGSTTHDGRTAGHGAPRA